MRSPFDISESITTNYVIYLLIKNNKKRKFFIAHFILTEKMAKLPTENQLRNVALVTRFLGLLPIRNLFGDPKFYWISLDAIYSAFIYLVVGFGFVSYSLATYVLGVNMWMLSKLKITERFNSSFTYYLSLRSYFSESL